MRKAITFAEIHADVLPEVPDALVEKIDDMLRKNRPRDPKAPIKINVSAVNELINLHMVDVDQRFTNQNMLDAVVLHYETGMQVWHENNILHFAPHFQNVGKYALRSDTQRPTDSVYTGKIPKYMTEEE